MRILVNDFGGYAFAARLSAILAGRGHTVCHAYCASLETTPPGIASETEPPPPRLAIRGLRLSEPLDKYSFLKRRRQEREYGRLICRTVETFTPDVVLSGNTPLDAQKALLATCRRRAVPFVYWLQDLLGMATYRVLRRKLGIPGQLVGRHYLRLERRLLRHSDRVVVITEDFVSFVVHCRVPAGSIFVIENWADLDALPIRPKDNPWSRAHGLHDKTCLLYAGTLSMKHNPELIVRLAARFKRNESVRVVVISRGMGADHLAERKEALDLHNLILLEYQPAGALPDVLGAADVLLAVLEPDAGEFSVPSKVLTYLCAGRPLLLAVPPTNLAARIVAGAGAGTVVPPDDSDTFASAAEDLVDCAVRRRDMGRRARAHAESAFDLDSVADRFMKVFERAIG